MEPGGKCGSLGRLKEDYDYDKITYCYNCKVRTADYHFPKRAYTKSRQHWKCHLKSTGSCLLLFIKLKMEIQPVLN